MRRPGSNLSKGEIERIKKILSAEERPPLDVIAARFNCHYGTIKRIKGEMNDEMGKDT